MEKKLNYLLLLTLLSAAGPCLAADSTAVVGPTSILPYYPKVTVPSPSIYNNAYSTLPYCYVTAGGSPSTNPINCPDINGNYANPSAPANCADACIVTRNPQTISQYTAGSAMDAVCPTGYVASGVFNPQTNYTYYPNPGSQIFPTTFSQYSSLNSGGNYSCNTSSYPNFVYSCEHLATPQGPYAYNIGQITDQLVPNAVINITGIPLQQGGWQPGCRTGSCSGAYCYTIVQYNYNTVYCQSRAGLNPEASTLPVTVVCSRVKAEWTPSNTPQGR